MVLATGSSEEGYRRGENPGKEASMATQKASAEEWAEYLALYRKLSEQLAQQPWFAGG